MGSQQSYKAVENAVDHKYVVVKQLNGLDIQLSHAGDGEDLFDDERAIIRTDMSEYMEKHSNVFAKIRDDYKQIMQEEEEKMLVFYTDCKIHTFGDFEKVLKEYAKTLDKKFKVKERGKYPKFYLNDEFYQAVYSFENPGYRIVCMKMKETKKRNCFLSWHIERHL